MENEIWQGLPWEYFTKFISLRADRFAILEEILKKARLDFNILDIAGNRHIFIYKEPLKRRMDIPPPGPGIILTAHYDRYEGSPGANDNSAGVFILLETAMNLKKKGIKNWGIIFTDKEELKPGEGILKQGSYSLANMIKTMGMGNSKIYCFDVCGTGDSLLVSSTLDYLLRREGKGLRTQKSLNELRKNALNTAAEIKSLKAYMVPAPFSDDAGFFRAGIAAQTITMLPFKEYNRLSMELLGSPECIEVLVNAELWHNAKNNFIPETWRILNSSKDNIRRLTPEYYPLVRNFAEALCIKEDPESAYTPNNPL